MGVTIPDVAAFKQILGADSVLVDVSNTSSTSTSSGSNHVEAVVSFKELRDGGRYWRKTREQPTLSRITNLENNVANQSSAHAGQFTEALTMIAAAEEGVPLAMAAEVPELRVVKSDNGQDVLDVDAVVCVDKGHGNTVYYVGEHKASTNGTSDVLTLLGKVDYMRSKVPHLSAPGTILKPAFMAEAIRPQALPMVDEVCRTKGVLRLKRNAATIVKASASMRMGHYRL